MDEIWKDVPGYNNWYQCSNLGRVKSKDRDVVYSNGHTHHYIGQILKSSIQQQGYCTVGIRDNSGHTKTVAIHRLVAITFLPNPYNKREVNHIDGDKTNNSVANLEWATTLEN